MMVSKHESMCQPLMFTLITIFVVIVIVCFTNHFIPMNSMII